MLVVQSREIHANLWIVLFWKMAPSITRSLSEQKLTKRSPLSFRSRDCHSLAHTSNHLLYKSQYGFRKHHSTELASLELVDTIQRQLDLKLDPFAMFLDMSKAFDTLDHVILLQKLSFYGVQNTSLNLFKSYLSERSQFVSI